MRTMPMITKVIAVSAGEKAQTGPTRASLQIEFQTDGGPAVLEIWTSAALELVEVLSQHLRDAGFL
jgi:hypothetical protein